MARSARLHDAPKRTRLWRIVAGAFLHFGVVAYMVVVPIACLLSAPAAASHSEILRLALRYSGWFLAGFAASALLAIVVAALADRRGAAADDPAALSRARVAEAVEAAQAMQQDAVRAAALAIAGRSWRHDDPRFQALARDFQEVVHTASAALASAGPASAAMIRDRTLASLKLLESALDELAGEQAAAHENSARATALYIERRYGSSDFTVKPE